MAENTQECPFPSPRLPVPGGLSQRIAAHKAELAIGVLAASGVALFVSAHWSIALVAGVAVFGLAAMESEALILLVILLLPLSWVVRGDFPLRSVPVAVRVVATVGFFSGRLLRGRLRVAELLSSPISKASIFFLGAVIASVVPVTGRWAHESARSLYAMVSYLGFFFLVLSWADSRQRLEKALRVLFWSTIVASLFGIYQEISGGFTSLWWYLNPIDEEFRWNGRVTSFLSHPNALAGYLNLILPFALGCCWFGKGRWKKLGALTLGLGLVALLCTQSLGGLLAFVSTLILAIFCFARSRKKRLALLASVCASVCLLYFLKQILNPTHTQEVLGFDMVSRLMLWNTAWGYFMRSPVFGVGWGNFVGLYGSDLYSFSSFIPPGQLGVHNIYLQFLAETGVVGFVVFFYLVVQSWRLARDQLRSSLDFLNVALAFGVLGALLSVLVHGFVDFLFQVSPQFGALFWVVLALLVANGVSEGRKQRGMTSPS
jgi:O-antigen ligase